MTLPCNHAWQNKKKYYSRNAPKKDGTRSLSTVIQVYGKTRDSHLWSAALGISWMKPFELAQAIPPCYSEFLGRQIIEFLRTARAA